MCDKAHKHCHLLHRSSRCQFGVRVCVCVWEFFIYKHIKIMNIYEIIIWMYHQNKIRENNISFSVVQRMLNHIYHSKHARLC